MKQSRFEKVFVNEVLEYVHFFVLNTAMGATKIFKKEGKIPNSFDSVEKMNSHIYWGKFDIASIQNLSSRHWIEACSEPNKLSMPELEDLDKNPMLLIGFYSSGHKLYDFNKKPISVPLHLSYIDWNIDNEHYILSKLLGHIKELAVEGKIKTSEDLEIESIPDYNSSEIRNRTIEFKMLLRQDIFDSAISDSIIKSVEKKDYSTEKEIFDAGYPLWNNYVFRTKVKTLLGFDQFKRPENEE